MVIYIKSAFLFSCTLILGCFCNRILFLRVTQFILTHIHMISLINIRTITYSTDCWNLCGKSVMLRLHKVIQLSLGCQSWSVCSFQAEIFFSKNGWGNGGRGRESDAFKNSILDVISAKWEAKLKPQRAAIIQKAASSTHVWRPSQESSPVSPSRLRRSWFYWF